MPDIRNFTLDLSYHAIWLVAGVFLLIALTYVFYRVTNPSISPFLKVVLSGIRALAIVLILFAIFEPVFNFELQEKLKAKVMFFVDNTASVNQADSLQKERLSNLANNINSSFAGNQETYMFGQNILPYDQFPATPFTYTRTNMENLFAKVREEEFTPAAVVIISDGNFNEGSSPIQFANKANFPVFTIGVGDTLSGSDIKINSVDHNRYVYKDKEISINVSVSFTDVPDKNYNITLNDGENTISKKVNVSGNGIYRVDFLYTPLSSGTKRMIVSVEKAENENNTENNRKLFYLNVKENKIKVVLVNSGPSADYRFLKNSLLKNENIELNEIVEVSNGKFLPGLEKVSKIDSADILYLTDFPSESTSATLQNRVFSAIKNNNTPYFFVLNSTVDITRLKQYESLLPVTIGSPVKSETLVQPGVVNAVSPLIAYSGNPAEGWESSSPVIISGTDIKVKPGAETVLEARERGISIEKPVLVTSGALVTKSIMVTVSNSWKWQLNSNERSNGMYDHLVTNSVNWLNTNRKNARLIVTTEKENYLSGEEIVFNAEYYDEALNPVDDADISIMVQGKNNTSIQLNAISSTKGNYSAELTDISSGAYTYFAQTNENKGLLKTPQRAFSVGEVQPELFETGLNKTLLEELAVSTGGKYYHISDVENWNGIKQNVSNKYNTRVTYLSTYLWKNEYLLLFIILLFALEWLLRKRSGLI